MGIRGFFNEKVLSLTFGLVVKLGFSDSLPDLFYVLVLTAFGSHQHPAAQWAGKLGTGTKRLSRDRDNIFAALKITRG